MNFGAVDSNKHGLLYNQVTEILERRIKETTVGSKFPTERELCKNLKVSLPTVRKALSKLVDKGYLTRRYKIGTVVISTQANKSIDLKRKNLVVYIYRRESNIDDNYNTMVHHTITGAIEEKIREKNLNLIYRVMDEDKLDLGGLKENVSGLILTGLVTSKTIRAVQETKIPFVLSGDPYEKEKAPPALDVAGSDDFQRISLVKLGHKRILYICRSTERFSWEIDMFRAYREALAQADIGYDGKLVMELEGLDEPGVHKAMADFLDKQVKFTGIICMTSNMYRGVMKALMENNIKVPENASVIVCDYAPADITRVEYDLKELGNATAELLYEKLTASAPGWKPKRARIPYRLYEGNTTKALKAGGRKQ